MASQLIAALWANRLGTLNKQVLQEFYVNVTAKIPRPLPKAEAATYVQRYFHWPVIRLSPMTIRKAFEIERRHRLSFWDAMIVSAAVQSGSSKIVSEDLNAGQEIAGITIVNPLI